MGSKRTNEPGLTVWGTNAVRELLTSEVEVGRVYLLRGRDHERLADLAERRGVPVELAPGPTLDRLAAGGQHQGAVAQAGRFRYVELEDVIAAPGHGVVVLDGIQDPRNLGAILRTARAAGVKGVVLPKNRSVGVTPVVVTASVGQAFGLPIARITNVVRGLETLKEEGFWTVGLVADAEQRLDRLDPLDRPALVMGGEGEGLRPLVRSRCDFTASIPMAAGVESLNVSVAAAIGLYELGIRGRKAPIH